MERFLEICPVDKMVISLNVQIFKNLENYAGPPETTNKH